MSNQLSNELKAQLFAQESDDPFLTLVTLQNPFFVTRLVNNSSDIISRANAFTAFPMKIRLPVDDGSSQRDFTIDFDNVSLELITNLRSVTSPIGVTIEMVLASIPDVVQMSFDELFVINISYTATRISARIGMDGFLAVEMTSERYAPTNFPGLF